MDRELPFRNKAPPRLEQLMQDAANSTYFLLQESGPTSFVIKDQLGRLFKVKLGSSHSCSCGGGKIDHCIHTLYVILKIFRVHPSNPISWQLSFNDTEINWLIQNRLQPMGRPQTKPHLKKQQSQRLALDEEFGCSICQENMKAFQSLVFCKDSCGHNFHAKCMKVWADHKTASRQPVTCPLCRIQWSKLAVHEIDKMAKIHRKVNKNGKKCSSCAAHIRGLTTYHCIVCDNLDICETCAENHPHTVIFKLNDQWLPRAKQGETNLDRPRMTLAHAVVDSINTPGFGVCCLCNMNKNCPMKELSCRHVAHTECLENKINDDCFVCPVDKTYFLPGLKMFWQDLPKEEPLSIGGVSLGRGLSNTQHLRRRPEIRARRRISRQLPTPNLVISGAQQIPIYRNMD